MKRRWLRFGMIGAALAVLGFLVAASGIIPLKASAGHWAITQWVLRFGMKRSIATHSLGIEAPDLRDPDLVLRGAKHYDMGCRSCHGEPGLPLPRIAGHMLPPPPELAGRVRESTPEKLFYVVKHGLKFTGMPAWPSPNRDDEVWAMVAFLQEYQKLDAAGYRRLARDEPRPNAPAEASAASALIPSTVAQSCAHCHDRGETGRDAFPRLAGQRREYLENAMHAYALGQRHSGTMGPIAAGLDGDNVRAVASYYAGLKPVRVPVATGATESIARGEKIAREGIRDQRVPACIECHGTSGKRTKPEYPLLAGQPADYLRLQLQLFKGEQRGGSEYAHLMRPVATRLTDDQMRDVAAYFESLRTAE